MNEIRFIVNLKYESSTIILVFGIRYSQRDLLSDLNNYAWPAKWRYASETLNDVNASCGISSPYQAVNSMSKRSFISTCLFFSGFKHDFIRCADFTRIAASSTESDYGTN